MTDDTTEGDPPNEYTGVAIYDENPYYWTYDGDPILLEGTAQLNYKEPLLEPPESLEAATGEDRFPVHSDWA